MNGKTVTQVDARFVGPNVSVYMVYIVLMELRRLVVPLPLSAFYIPFIIYFQWEGIAKSILGSHPALRTSPCHRQAFV